ncbi:hypothetical protein AA958_29270 [Streptomyces sp. CNQ-509]|nr:hypothetical protein AA958_29270 [Streptomyces sp. CNQ-509]
MDIHATQMAVQGETITTGFGKRPTGGAVPVEAVPAPSVAAPGWSSGLPSPPAGRLHARTHPGVDELILRDAGTGIAPASAAPRCCARIWRDAGIGTEAHQPKAGDVLRARAWV